MMHPRSLSRWSMPRTLNFKCKNYVVVFAGQMCVHLAAIGGHVDVLRHLVWFGANINARVSIFVVFVNMIL